jgi:2-amino-4-hydroxy-6-hydroxymethyldihydropteridine diphosphokinase
MRDVQARDPQVPDAGTRDTAVIAYVALGSNLGDREALLRAGRQGVAALPRTRVIKASAVEHTAPLGPVQQGAYLNMMLAVETTLAPEALLDGLLAVEGANGRTRDGARWGPRTLDLDVVLYGDERIATPRLVVPHPELPNRAFWQRELAELGHPAYARLLAPHGDAA